MERTDAEILKRVEELGTGFDDWLGTQRCDLIEVLSFEAAKPFLKDEASEENWTLVGRDAASVKARILDYMPFAWGKANDCRGISAGRSLDHMKAWLWLLGYDEAAGALSDYDRYGKPQLRAICEAFGWDWRQWDDGHWSNEEDGPNYGVPETVPPLPIAA